MKGTEYDFRTPKLLSECVVSARQGEGYCVNFCVDNKRKLLRCIYDNVIFLVTLMLIIYSSLNMIFQFSHVATLEHELSKRKLEVWSDQPGLELYTGNFLPTGNYMDMPLKGNLILFLCS